MKKLAVSDINACMNCLTCETACAGAFYKKESPFQNNLTCLHVTSKNGALKIVTCVQCGKCAKNCEAEAITQNKAGVYIINKEKCKKCGKCVEVCPFHVMVLLHKDAAPSKCISCGICVKACPQNVLTIKTAAA
ncbi:MAG: 4Fe-4S binding protein [Spirochaetaceae bacterium]|jgi:Fe-S-cluster-containing hydrogenase component 2|nr:4Fe-4S binding protein [Spirochaetaceae bacterium]